MPIELFWMLHRNVDRLRADDDYRQAIVVAHAMAGGEGLADLMEKLKEQVGMVVDVDEGLLAMERAEVERDVDGLNDLKSLGKVA